MRACCLAFTCGLTALTALLSPTCAQDEPAKFVPPPNALPLDDSGTLDHYQSDLLRIRDSKMDLWLLKILPTTTISVTGTAKADYLRPGLGVEFDNELNKKGELTQPIAEINLLPDKTTLGLFAADEDANDARPIRNPEAGAYHIRGKVAAVKDGQLTVSIGGKRYTGELAEGEEFKINFTSDDPSVAAMGDTVKVKAWYFDNTKPVSANNIPGRALAEDIAITLAKPPEPAGRRGKR
jgi:hypothetical protein